MIPRFLPSFVSLLGVLLFSGCASSLYHLEGVGPDGRTAPEVRYTLEADQEVEGTITVVAHGHREMDLEGRRTDAVVFSIMVDNSSEDPLELPLELVSVSDDQQRVLRRHEAHLPPGASAEAAVVAPQERTSVDLLYDAGGPGTLKTTGSLTLEWGYRFRGQEIRHRTRFLPVRYRRSTVVYHTGFYYGPYFGFGPVWCW